MISSSLSSHTSASQRVLLIALVSLLALATVVADELQVTDDAQVSQPAGLAQSRVELARKLPDRQQPFKIRIVQGGRKSANVKRTDKQRKGPNEQPAQVHQIDRRAFKSSLEVSDTKQRQKQKQLNHKLNNATLKKLLNQSLAKQQLQANSTLGKGANFKLLFIQRATAAPTSPHASSGSPVTSAPPPRSVASTQSLAASVSRHLADSLMQSAATLVDNLSPLGPLTTRPADERGLSDAPVSSTSATSTTSTTTTTTTRAPAGDLERIRADKGDKGMRRKASDTQSNKAARRKQSKVYNLPVKFTSNGQPSDLVFSTIRQHFSTIKKLQQQAGQLNSKRRKQQHTGKSTKPLKGVNSRLIYLPLKYLSNARPDRILAGRATHKALLST